MQQRDWFKTLEGLVVGDYTLHEFVGAGRVGVVYRACQTDLPERILAVKLIPGSPRAGYDNELKKVSLLATIPNVAHFHGSGTASVSRKGRTEVVMFTTWDYIAPGRNLERYLSEKGCLLSFFLAVIEQVLLVLHACQAKKLPRHGDLHPGNILIGDPDEADLDPVLLTAREQIYISDFGYGATGGAKAPKDDYGGLAEIASLMTTHVRWETCTASDKRLLRDINGLLQKLLRETSNTERQAPLQVLTTIKDLRNRSRLPVVAAGSASEPVRVGHFQVAEMLGERWDYWKSLFVAALPARSRVLDRDIATVLTGPRGCGKTMLFRRLSERVSVECGSIEDDSSERPYVGFYVNANAISDAFPRFPSKPSVAAERRLIAYANLSLLSDFLAVQAARAARFQDTFSLDLLAELGPLVWRNGRDRPAVGEDPLEHLRGRVETLKAEFLELGAKVRFPGLNQMGHHGWLPGFIELAYRYCSWLTGRFVFVFVDDYTTPRITTSMQRVLNRIWFQRGSTFVCKIATEAATTFLPEDSTGKALQDGDDYLLVDLAEESLFLHSKERRRFLEEVFQKRLNLDPRIPKSATSLELFLGTTDLSKTEFARRLRADPDQGASTPGGSQRRGATRPRALYYGSNTFVNLWSGDTRTMIQLMQELVDEALTDANLTRDSILTATPIRPDVQDRVLRSRGGEWLGSLGRNQPTDPGGLRRTVRAFRRVDPGFKWTGGTYGTHLKAIAEAFKVAARQLLLGPALELRENGNSRTVPRMAFRIEILDEFRLEPLATHVYSDLIRYGVFLRDSRGKSVRGAMVPRLYLRRFLLPYCALALSKRDSVQLPCASFEKLLLYPDRFSSELGQPRREVMDQNQLGLGFQDYSPDPRYDDLAEDD